MNCFSVIIEKAAIPVMTLMIWLATNGVVMAQEPEVSGSAYTLPYLMVVMGIILGVVCISYPSRRRDRARPKQYIPETDMAAIIKQQEEEEAQEG